MIFGRFGLPAITFSFAKTVGQQKDRRSWNCYGLKCFLVLLRGGVLVFSAKSNLYLSLIQFENKDLLGGILFAFIVQSIATSPVDYVIRTTNRIPQRPIDHLHLFSRYLQKHKFRILHIIRCRMLHKTPPRITIQQFLFTDLVILVHMHSQ